MKSNSDLPIRIVAALTGTMLLMVFVSESMPAPIRTIIFAICIVGIIGVLVLKNLLSGPRAAIFRKLFGLGFLVFWVILVSIILFDVSFAPGDTLRFGMEPATAMLVFGITLFPFSFVLLWVLGFDRAVLTPEKEQHLKKLTEEGKEDVSNG
jgi:hypothetical protein